MSEQQTCSVARAAELLGIGRSQCTKLCRAGKIDALMSSNWKRPEWRVVLGDDGLPITRDWQKGRRGRRRKEQQ